MPIGAAQIRVIQADDEYAPQKMAVWRMWHPKYGVIYDEAKGIERGDYERRRERDPTDQAKQVARRALA